VTVVYCGVVVLALAASIMQAMFLGYGGLLLQSANALALMFGAAFLIGGGMLTLGTPRPTRWPHVTSRPREAVGRQRWAAHDHG
jgi:hypothetical protein